MSKHPLSVDITPTKAKAERGQGNEHKAVAHLMAHYGLHKMQKSMIYDCKREGLPERLSFVDFHCIYPSFPVYLVTNSIPWLWKDITITGLLGKTTTRKLVNEYLTQREEYKPAEYICFGMIVPWVGISKGLIIHDNYMGLPDVPGTASFVWFHADGDILTLEPFSQFLKLTEWTAEDADV